jgi:hypothetical protein
MKPAEVYVDLDGHEIALAGLDERERRLVARLRRRARIHPDWTAFDNYWMRELIAFYDARGVRRAVMKARAPYRIAQDLSARLGIATCFIRPPDLLGDLEDLILDHFPSRRAFAKATGVSEELVDDLLAGRKPLALEVLEPALERIGYWLQIRPAPEIKPAQSRKRTG